MGGRKKRTTAEAEHRTPSPSPSRISPTPAAEMNLKQHFDERFNEMRTLLEAAIEELKAANAAKDAEIEELKGKLTICEAKLERLDRDARAQNMILYNVPEVADPADTVKSLFPPASSGNIVTVHRLGRFVAGARRPRPVLVKFSSVQAKHEAFKSKKEVAANRKIFMDDDLTEKQRTNRKQQLPTFVRLKEAGMRPFWRGDKIMQVTQQGVRPVQQGGNPSPA